MSGSIRPEQADIGSVGDTVLNVIFGSISLSNASIYSLTAHVAVSLSRASTTSTPGMLFIRAASAAIKLRQWQNLHL